MIGNNIASNRQVLEKLAAAQLCGLKIHISIKILNVIFDISWSHN